MVKLSFKVIVQKEFNAVWEYFSQFSNINKWDPNTTACTIIKQQPGKIGSKYRIMSLFKEKQSELIYETRNYKVTQNYGMINLWGENDMTTAQDEISCKRLQNNRTQILYKANICLKGIAVLATPFIICSLNDLTEQARLGCVKKARQLWGKAQ